MTTSLVARQSPAAFYRRALTKESRFAGRAIGPPPVTEHTSNPAPATWESRVTRAATAIPTDPASLIMAVHLSDAPYQFQATTTPVYVEIVPKTAAKAG